MPSRFPEPEALKHMGKRDHGNKGPSELVLSFSLSLCPLFDTQMKCLSRGREKKTGIYPDDSQLLHTP